MRDCAVSCLHATGALARMLVVCSALVVLQSVSGQQGQQESPIAEARARKIVASMTVEEKISQVHGIYDENHFRYVPGVPRLGIPPLQITNGPAGVGPGGSGPRGEATALPAPIALAATWNEGLARAYGRLSGEETRARGAALLEAPAVNIVRVPQGGRTFETYSEDPFLTSRITVADIEGIQSAGVLANVKHFLANNQEADRMSLNAEIGERALHEIYLPAFEAAVKEAHVASVMCAYPRVNGVFDCENGPLLRGVLKDVWKFDGFVMSDFGAVHSTVASALAGLDLEMPTGEYFSAGLLKAVDDGEVPITRVDDMLIRRYTKMIEAGLFDGNRGTKAFARAVPVLKHGAIAREIAEQGMVLLKNNRDLLPLNPTQVKSIALIGPQAIRAVTGGGGSSHVVPYYSIQPADGVSAQLASRVAVDVEDGSDIDAAVRVASKSDVVLLMVGDNESEGHDHAIQLSGRQDQLVMAVAAANPHTIVILESGSAVLMPWIDETPAVLEAWYPGEEGGAAIADVIFGKSNPSGRLPISFPAKVDDTLARSASQYPGDGRSVHYSEGLNVGYRGYAAEGIRPLFPFGFGLSYTEFAYSNLAAEKSISPKDGTPKVKVSFDVTNTGSTAGADVPQIYVGFPPIAEGNEPPLQLKGFSKILLQPGEKRRVEVHLDARAFSYWSPLSSEWRIESGTYKIILGASSADLRETREIQIP